jgi:hypothetical protein
VAQTTQAHLQQQQQQRKAAGRFSHVNKASLHSAIILIQALREALDTAGLKVYCNCYRVTNRLRGTSSPCGHHLRRDCERKQHQLTTPILSPALSKPWSL